MTYKNPKYPTKCRYFHEERGKLKGGGNWTIFRCKLPQTEKCIRQRKMRMCDVEGEPFPLPATIFPP